MTTEVFPLGTKLLAAEVKKERKTESGIFIGDAKTMNETSAAHVLAVGPDVTDIKVGTKVYLDWTKTKLIIIDGAQRVIVDREDIHALIV